MSIAHRCDLCKRIVDTVDLRNNFSLKGEIAPTSTVQTRATSIVLVGFMSRLDLWQSNNLSIRKQKNLSESIDVCNECLLNIRWKIK